MEILAKPRNKRQFQRSTKIKFYFDAKAGEVRAKSRCSNCLLNLLRSVNAPILEARYDLEVRTVWLDNEIVVIATADRDCRLKSPAPLRSVSIRKRNGIGFGLAI
jgi:hypothetical protein